MSFSHAEYYDRTDACHKHWMMRSLAFCNKPPTFTKTGSTRQVRWRLFHCWQPRPLMKAAPEWKQDKSGNAASPWDGYDESLASRLSAGRTTPWKHSLRARIARNSKVECIGRILRRRKRLTLRRLRPTSLAFTLLSFSQASKKRPASRFSHTSQNQC